MKKSVFAAALVASSLTGLVLAQQTGLNRVGIQTVDSSIAGKTVIQARVEFDTGAVVARHTHPGDEISYVMEGQLELKVDGEPVKIVKAGEGFMVPEGKIHSATSGNGKAKVLVTYVVTKGQPVATPAK